MTKLIFIFSLLIAVCNAVLYGRDVSAKEDFSQGYRYSRPAPHYLPPYQQESSTQATNHYYPTATIQPPTQQQQQQQQQSNWQQQSWMSSPPTLVPPREKPFMGIFRPDVSIPSNHNPYNYQNTASQGVFVTTAKPNVNYHYMRPEHQLTEMPSSAAYYYGQQIETLKPTNLPVTQVSRPSSSSGYNYMQSQATNPQASNPMEYFYNKPEKTSYNPATLTNSGSNSNYYNQGYETPQAPLNFGSQGGSSFNTPSFSTSLTSAMPSYQRPNNYETDYSASSSSNQIGTQLTGGHHHHQPWYMNQKIESTNNYNNQNNDNWNLPLQQQQQQQQFRPSSTTQQYLPPKVEFQPPYYKK